MKRLTKKGIERYIINNYGASRHNFEYMRMACIKVSKMFKCSPIEIFHFMIENEPIKGLNTHSYGFNTSFGRHIKDEFKNAYYD